jgi:DNA-binding IscR family transcriptional regulator
VEICADPQSVAEISAHLKIPLGVARVIVGDLAAEGLVAANAAAGANTTAQSRPDIKLLERVLDGRRAL